MLSKINEFELRPDRIYCQIKYFSVNFQLIECLYVSSFRFYLDLVLFVILFVSFSTIVLMKRYYYDFILENYNNITIEGTNHSFSCLDRNLDFLRINEKCKCLYLMPFDDNRYVSV